MAILVHHYNGLRGVARTISFCMPDVMGTAGQNERLDVAATAISAAEVKISKDGGSNANATNAPVQIVFTAAAGMYTLALTSAEMDADQIIITVIESTAATTSDVGMIIQTQKYWMTHYMDAGLAAAGGASTITLRSGASSTDDYYNGNLVRIISGVGAGQMRYISDYVGSSRVATVSRAWTTNPDATSAYEVLQSTGVWEETEGTENTVMGNDMSFRNIMQALKRRFFNRVTQTDSVQTVYRDDSTSALSVMAVSDDGSIQIKGKTA